MKFLSKMFGKTSSLPENIVKAIDDGDLKSVTQLLKERPSLVASKDEQGYTLLHLAAGRYSTEMINFLIAKGAKVNARNENGGTPMHFTRSPWIVEALLSHGADINAKDNEGWTILDMEVYEGQGHEDMIEFIRANGGREYIRKRGNPFSQFES